MRKNFVEIFLLASLMLASLVNACSNPIIRNQNGVPTYNFNVVYADYPSDATIINYNLNITNTNNQALNITFTPLSNLLNYVYGTEASLSARETKQVPLQINIGSDDVVRVMVIK
ncbi:MAG: hypothetical protein NTW30_06055 [Candidatus Aenigmarchaeota archaeon]|nr:hypothetical protein [Candidatus Aenigmarchaeota archaeon]